MHIDRSTALKAFRSYIALYDPTNPRIALKVQHTYRVAALCEDIAQSLELDSDEIDLAWLCGLLHDIGRFEQVKRYDTFVDAKSASHAALGVEVLSSEEDEPGSIRSFIADSSCDDLILACVGQHSALKVDPTLDEHTKQMCSIVRDADKIDILRVNHDSPVEDIYPFGEEELFASRISPEVAATFFRHESVPHAIRHYPADMLAGHACFVWDLAYRRSLELAVKQGYLFSMLERPFGRTDTAAEFQRMDEHLRSWVKEQGFEPPARKTGQTFSKR